MISPERLPQNPNLDFVMRLALFAASLSFPFPWCANQAGSEVFGTIGPTNRHLGECRERSVAGGGLWRSDGEGPPRAVWIAVLRSQ